MSAGVRRFSVQVPDWGQDHLSAEAVVAYVDGELGERPHDRATRHLAECAECAAQVVMQGQARSALRSARCPSLSSSLMSSLRSIPQVAEIPGAPNGLAMSPDGQLVAMLRPPPPSSPPASVKARLSRLGTGAAISGLALGALALGAAIIAGDTPDSPGPLGHGGAPVVVDARLQLPGPP